MSAKHVMKIGDEVLLQRRGRQRISLIEYFAESKDSEPQYLTSVHCSDCFNERCVFTFESGHWAYGSQVVSMPLAREIFT